MLLSKNERNGLMPCYSGPTLDEIWEKEDRENAIARAGLCLMISLHGIPENTASYKKAGISKKQLAGWYKQHLAEDAEKKRREEERKNRKKNKRSGLAKLTTEERRALGLAGGYSYEED
jgi:hypothetical protein